MSIPNSHLSYVDCYNMLNSALDNERGVRIRVDLHGSANFLRMRLHMARTIDRRRNKEIYTDPAHALHGASMYDGLMVRIKPDGDKYWVYIEKVASFTMEVEALGPDLPALAPPTRLQLEPPKVDEDFELEVSEPKPTQPSIRRL